MVALVFVMGCAMAFLFIAVLALANGMNKLHQEVDRLKLAKGLAASEQYEITIKKHRSEPPRVMRVFAVSEGDAVRQMLSQGVDPKHIVEIRVLE